VSPDLNDMYMVTGEHKRVSNIVNEIDSLDQNDNGVHIYKDPVSIYQALLETLKTCSTMIFEEDYNAWNSFNCKSRMGKAFLIDQADYTT